MLNKTTLGIAAGLSGLLFVGYCIYFDHQRHKDPSFKRKLREKRRQKRLAKAAGSRIPDLRDQEAVQRFFLTEIQVGEDLLSQGDVEGAVEHIGSAIAVCGHPQQLLQILQQTLPPQVFHILLQRLPSIGQAVHTRQINTYGVDVAPGGAQPGLMMPMGMGMALGGGGANVLNVDDELE